MIAGVLISWENEFVVGAGGMNLMFEIGRLEDERLCVRAWAGTANTPLREKLPMDTVNENSVMFVEENAGAFLSSAELKDASVIRQRRTAACGCMMQMCLWIGWN